MSRFSHSLRQALTIARRDLRAMVMTPTFLLFLLSPLLMVALGTAGSLSASSAMQGGDDKQRLVVIAAPEYGEALTAADSEMRRVSHGRPELLVVAPTGDGQAQARALFDDSSIDTVAVLYGPLVRPHILRAADADAEASYLQTIAAQAALLEKAGMPVTTGDADIQVFDRKGTSPSGRNQAAFLATAGVFFLTFMLSGQAVGAMAEERSNKVIEVLAAAVPLESVFFGKLLGTFGSALLFVGFWGTLLLNLPRIAPAGFADWLSQMGTAVGPVFGLLFVLYFAMAYLLQSAIYLGLGSQMGSQREIQMLSLPITMFQFGMFGLASYAAGHPGTWLAIFAEIFPFSSPLAMIARAANAPELWPHLLALGWQVSWVALTVTIAARLFRRGVLQSGSPPFWKRKRLAIDTAVN